MPLDYIAIDIPLSILVILFGYLAKNATLVGYYSNDVSFLLSDIDIIYVIKTL